MEVKEIKISRIKGALAKLRLERDYEKDELLASIKEKGILNPVKVKTGKGGYILFAGHRRMECAVELHYKTIRAEIWEGISDAEAVLLGFVDNINRKDFTPLEQAYAFKTLKGEYGYSIRDLINSSGKERSRVYELIRMADRLPQRMYRAVLDEKMSTGHALILLRIEDDGIREKLFQRVIKDELSVQELRFIVHRLKPDSEKNDRELLLDLVEDIYEKDSVVQKMWGETVRMRRSRKGDKLELEFTDPENLRATLLALLKPLQRNLRLFKKLDLKNGGKS